MSLFLIQKMLTNSLGIAKEIAKELEMESSKIEKETPKHMEEIKLPKFKTKEELDQFAMGLMTENESLKSLIKYKDETIKELFKNTEENLHTNTVLLRQKDTIKRLESEVESLKEKTNGDYYKKLYNKEFEDKWDYQRKFEKAEWLVHKLLTMVTFMYGLLNRFQAKRVFHAFGEFNEADYRL